LPPTRGGGLHLWSSYLARLARLDALHRLFAHFPL
jgi:hypothetical protein